jgi:hypothetical protein
MNVFRDTLTDLRDKRLWPVAAALLAALVAIPVLLSSGGGAPSVPPIPVGQLAQSGPTLPAVSVTTVTPAHTKLTGRGRDPFSQRPARTTVAPTTKPSGATTTTPQAGGGTPTRTTAAFGGTPTPAATRPPAFPTAKAAAPVGLTASQSYNVSLSITNSSGGLDTIDSLERLSVLPNRRVPLLVELGVLKGGKRVLFALTSYAVVHGPGRCTPSRADCQILVLARGQVESLAARADRWTSPSALFAVTAIRAQGHGSAAAAAKLRRRESAAGRRLLNNSRLNALSKFRYEPSLGAIVDLRNS